MCQNCSRVLAVYKVVVEVAVAADVACCNVDHDLCFLNYDDDDFKGNMMRMSIVRKMCLIQPPKARLVIVLIC